MGASNAQRIPAQILKNTEQIAYKIFVQDLNCRHSSTYIYIYICIIPPARYTVISSLRLPWLPKPSSAVGPMRHRLSVCYWHTVECAPSAVCCLPDRLWGIIVRVSQSILGSECAIGTACHGLPVCCPHNAEWVPRVMPA